MITIEHFLNVIQMKITGGEEFQWDCYGKSPRIIMSEKQADPEKNLEHNYEYSIECIFEPFDPEVREIIVWDFKLNNVYRWVSPSFREARKKEVVRRNLGNYDVYAFDDVPYTDVENEDDILEKARAIVNEEEYDERVAVDLDIPDDILFKLMKRAHDADMTFNDYLNRLMEIAVKEFDM